MKYQNDEAKELQELGEIPDNVKINEGGIDLGSDEDDSDDGLGGNDSSDEEETKKDDIDIDDI